MAYSDRFVAFKYRDFRLLWIGQFISITGSQMQMVALNWHIYVLTNSPIALGIIGLMRVLPIIFFSLLAGSFADSYNRKKVLLAAQILLTLFSLILAYATFSKIETPLIIYIVTALSAAAVAFDMPARQALVPSLVDRKDLSNAMSLQVIMQQVSTIVGPAVAGFVIAQFGVASVYAFNAFSFVAVIGALILMHNPGHIVGEKSTISLQSVAEGLRFVRSKTIIWSTMILDFFSTFFSSATALLPIFARDILHVGPEGLGFLYAAPSIGALVAGFIMTHVGPIKKQGKLLLLGVTCYAIGTILFGFSNTIILSLIALFIIGAGDSISTIIRNTIRQLATPDSIRGRMTGINMIFFMGGPQLGEFEAGLLAFWIGAPLSVVTGGAATLLVVGLVAIYIPTLRKYEGHELL